MRSDICPRCGKIIDRVWYDRWGSGIRTWSEAKELHDVVCHKLNGKPEASFLVFAVVVANLILWGWVAFLQFVLPWMMGP
jgi:hypothetical protein